jgi:gas vesicle protein GvpL/GvpF
MPGMQIVESWGAAPWRSREAPHMVPLRTYVYAIVRASSRPLLAGLPAPIPEGEPVRLVAVDGRTWIVVSSVPPGSYGSGGFPEDAGRIDWIGPRAISHAAIIEHFLHARAVLPMRLFTTFASDARALANVRREWHRIESVMARIEDRHEWRVRIGAATISADEWDAGRAAAARVYRLLAREADEARRHEERVGARRQSTLFLDAALLVPGARTESLRAAVRDAARDEPRIRISLTGPWPPYSFV